MILSAKELPIEDYHRSDAVSSSKLRDFRERGAWYYREKYVARAVPDVDTDALAFGRAFDTLLTEGPEVFGTTYVVKPAGLSLATKDGKAWKAENEGKEFITAEDFQRIRGMVDSILVHPIAADLCLGAEAQVSFRHVSERFGLTLQCRPDFFSRKPNAHSAGRPWLNDIKTTADLTDWVNESDPGDARAGSPVWKYGYHRQGGLAQYVCAAEPGIGITSHFLTVIEKQLPHRCAVVMLTDHYLDIGWRECESDLERLGNCVKRNEWPRGPAGIVALNPPIWMANRDERGAA